MSATVEQRLERIERLLRQMTRTEHAAPPKRMCEEQVMIKYQIGRSSLRKLRNGDSKNPAQLFKWTHIEGRRIEYDVAELDKYFKRTSSTPVKGS